MKKKDFSERSKREREAWFESYGHLYGEKMPEKRNVEPVAPRSRTKRTYPERDLVHLPLMAWARKFLPCHDLLIHIGNERHCSAQQGSLLKIMGVRAGCSDLFLAMPTRNFPGYWIELKAPGKKPSESQIEFLRRMKEVGYATDWFDDWGKAKNSILKYLG